MKTLRLFLSVSLLFGFACCLIGCQFARDESSSRTNDSLPVTSQPPPTKTDDTATPRALEAKWYVDSDGNAIPDFIEAEAGNDPLREDCASKECGAGAEGDLLLKKERNMLLMLDSSGSMAGDKMPAAKSAISRYARAVSEAMKLGFLVYGHKGNNTPAGKAESCAGVELLASIGAINKEQFQALLDQFQPTGWTPIARRTD